MYYIVDLTNGTRIPFDCKQALLFRWRQMTTRPFHYQYVNGQVQSGKIEFLELNITGKDKRCNNSILRRYQVMDDAGLSCDIRTWEKEIREVEAAEKNQWLLPLPEQKDHIRFRIDPVGGRAGKEHAHRRPLGAFTKASLSAGDRAANTLNFEDDLCSLTPVLDHSRPRKTGAAFSVPHFRGGRDGKCWKSGTKNQAQWGRHKKRCAVSAKQKSACSESFLRMMESSSIHFGNELAEWLDEMAACNF